MATTAKVLSLHFLVGTCLQTPIACDLLRNNLKSILRFHPQARITVCVDNSLPDMVAEIKKSFLFPNIAWVNNPFPKSGEFGLFYVASHMEGDTPETTLFALHDSTCMRRAITEQDIEFISDFKPLWNTLPTHAIFHTDSPLPLIRTHVFPAARVKMDVSDFAKFKAMIENMMQTSLCVTFGVMAAGKVHAFRRIWESGLNLLPPEVICTRADRCQIERLVSVCAYVAGFRTDSALCGDIMLHERVHGFFGLKPTCTSYPLFSDEEALPTQSPFYKLWLGR